MAYSLILREITPINIPSNGLIVGYRILGSTAAYTVAGPFFDTYINIPTTDPIGTLYEGYIKRDCGANSSTNFFWQTPCNCLFSGYTVAASGTRCETNDTVPATVTNSGFCLAPSTNTAYANYGSRIYKLGASDVAVSVAFETAHADIYATTTTAGQWANNTITTTDGPMNRDAVWIDSDCDGTRNALTANAQTTISTMYNNVTGANKTVYIGVGGDNVWTVSVNGTVINNSAPNGENTPFKIWHLIPVVLLPGENHINVVGTGDGGINDSLAMVVYDNTAEQLLAATSDTQLNILFRTGSLRGTTFDVATCPAGYSLDSTGGSGNYFCTKTLYRPCNEANN